MARQRPAARVYELKVTLRGVRPPVWRRVRVRDDTSLATLHEILQVCIGWTNSHLHQFVIGGTRYSDPDFGLDAVGPRGLRDEHRVTLAQVAPREKRRFVYEYDFGDGWMHEILVERIMAPEPGMRLPICVAGRRACPPEDVGGPWGYADFLEALGDPAHPEHAEYEEWIGGSFDPEEFDLEGVNRALRSVR